MRDPILLDVERYELAEPPAYSFTPTRREFLQTLGAGLLFTVIADGAPDTLSARLHIAEDGMVTVFSGKVEFGQGARTELAMAAAEELRLPLDKVRMVLADTDLVPNDGITAGSRSTPSTVPAVRQAGAAARALLEQSGASSYAEFARSGKWAAGAKNAPSNVTVTPVKDWRVFGQSQVHTQARDIVTGRHQYPSDIRRPNMLYGAVLRAPGYGATLKNINLEPARKLDGVVVCRDGAFAGCAAPTSFAAREAIAQLAAQAEWDQTPQPSSGELFAYLKQHPRSGMRGRDNEKGSVEAELARAAQRLSATYTVPFIQHAPMEPRAAVAEWNDGRLTVWTATQNPFGVRDQLVRAFQLSPSNVRVIVPDSGGGFGGKHTGETAIEAARLAKEAKRPVSLRWTREEEFTWAYFRPAGLFEMRAALDANGLLMAWDFTNHNAGGAALDSPYRAAASRTRFIPCESPLREGSYRGIAATANNFAREAFVDELAAAAKSDPLDFRLKNLDSARLKAVLNAAAERFRYRERLGRRKPNTGVGIACGTEKGSYVAVCVEVALSGGVRVTELCTAFECGAVLNPANLQAQVDGCVLQGLGGALTEQMIFSNGKLANGSFQRYKVPRFRDVPRLETVLVDRKDLPSAGAGETPIIGVAPAIAAAIFQGSGRRVRALPLG